MRWEAANVIRSPTDANQDNHEAFGTKGRRSTETAEAALSRLTKSYSSGISCIGALNRADSVLYKDFVRRGRVESDNLPGGLSRADALEQLKRVATAARSSLEIGVLVDPLILSYVPTLYHTIQCLAEESRGEEEHWDNVLSPRQAPPLLTSAAHRATVRELAYLSLVNYGDLLLSACTCSNQREETQGNSILDRGVAEKLRFLVEKAACCWGEKEDITFRLALAAFCDASEIHGSDPSLWLKLACTARGLDNILAHRHYEDNAGTPDVSNSPRRYRRLERHALESGRLALPVGLPQNRMVSRALEELNRMGQPISYSSTLACPSENTTLELDIPRYSWSVLGRMLIKACREGVTSIVDASGANTAAPGCRTWKTWGAFGSPAVVLRISPMLALPTSVLGIVCQFLTADSVWRFESTCRALSVSIISARASMEQEFHTSTKTEKQRKSATDESKSNLSSVGGDGLDIEQRGATVERSHDDGQRGRRTDSHRSSKRVRSQIITSGKLAERSARRNSIEFCLLACVLSCTADNKAYDALLRESVVWDCLLPLKDTVRTRVRSLSSGSSTVTHGVPESADKKLQYRRRVEARERAGGASLTCFIEQWSGRNSGPLDMLSRFVTHVSLNVSDVFTIDPGGSMILASCLLESVDLLSRRSGFNPAIAPSLCGSEHIEVDVGQVAVNLLNAELRLKRCERHPVGQGYDQDANALSVLVPVLLRVAESANNVDARERIWTEIKTRCHWLAAGFFLWRGKVSQNVSESRMAEAVGLEHIEHTMACLKAPAIRPIKIVRTPHLESPVRADVHWKSLSVPILSAFRDDIQASSIVSLARQQFLEIVGDVAERFPDVDEGVDVAFPQEAAAKLVAVGEKLFQRYDNEYETRGGKHEELLNDFRLTCIEDLIDSDWEDEMKPSQGLSRWKNLWELVPSTTVGLKHLRKMPNPSILTILVTCLQSKPDCGVSVVLLLTRLVLSAYEQQGFLSQPDIDPQGFKTMFNNDTGYDSDDNDGFSDSDSSVESNDVTPGASENRKHRGSDLSKESLCLLVQFFIDKISDICSSHLSVDEKTTILGCQDFLSMVHFSLAFSAEWYNRSVQISATRRAPLDFEMFLTIRSLMSCFLSESIIVEERLRLESTFFVGIARIIVSQRRIFPSLLRSHGDNRTGRAVRQKLCAGRAEYVGSVASEAACMLSRNLAHVRGGTVSPSFLVEALNRNSSEEETTSQAALPVLCNSVLWFFKYASNPVISPRTPTSANTINSFDRPIIEQLKAPVGAFIVSLCGSAFCATPFKFSQQPGSEGELCIGDFFDSDASANGWDASDDDDSEEIELKHRDGNLLRCLCQGVQCVALVFGALDEKLINSASSYPMHTNDHGPLLPLVVTRVLSLFSETLLCEYGDFSDDETKRRNVWAKEYPFGTRTTGRLLDSTLYKAYRCLHGFSLASGSTQGSTAKEHGTLAVSHDEVTTKRYAPESAVAAAQLYQCIVRAYANGRKSPPKAALECVVSALPPAVENEKSTGIREFLFSAADEYFEPADVEKLVKKGINTDSLNELLPVWIVEGENNGCSLVEEHTYSEQALMVRKGVCHELAKGTLPQLSSTSVDIANFREDDTKDTEEREIAACHERELSKKFQAILDDLCYGESLNCESWYRAGQCLLLKAELIADRLGSSKTLRAVDFTIPEHRSVSDGNLRFAALVTEQEREYKRQKEGWVPHVGKDLSMYIRHPWSTFTSLSEISSQIGSCECTEMFGQSDGYAAYSTQVWKEVESMYQKNDFVAWQQAWGGMFVSALRKVAMRCLFVAMYLALKQSKNNSSDENLVAEISESLGTSYYSMLMGSQVYGYPMHRMTDYRKRQLGETALVCFRHAVDMVSHPENEDDSRARETWDLLFMIGKCHEKVAGTYKGEAFVAEDISPPEDNSPFRIRQYERQMEKALDCYSTSWKQARTIEEDGGLADIQGGGSEHGALELFYRLHASRFKCLLFSVRQRSNMREFAEAEALRLSTKHWYIPPSDEEIYNEQMIIREKVWAVLADVVAALAQCRLEQPFFHRSVYRHAQALMWAQVFFDPIAGKVEKSLGSVPATKSYRIRGLNSATPCAHSAEVILGSLFNKKRPQLCAVWVTTPSWPPSPFPFLNNSIRKYDSLRAKYLSAWIDCLRICQRTCKLETLLHWTASSKRDLPSLFRASAMSKGGLPNTPHHRDRLLPKKSGFSSLGLLQIVKRQANGAIARVVISDLSKLPDTKDKKVQAQKVEHLKNAYKCFLRLNCTVSDVEQSRAWRFGSDSVPEVEALCVAFLATNDNNTILDKESNWSGKGKKITVLNAALESCRKQFPGLSSSLQCRSSKKRKQSTGSKISGDPRSPSLPTRLLGQEPANQNKRSRMGENKKESFLATVPSGLKEGDKFHISVRVGDVRRQVKLTVPAGNPSKLKFSLSV